jgi:flagellar basal body L-ring protein FlgH
MGPWYTYIEEMVKIDLLPNGNVVDSNGSNTNDGKCATKQSDCMANKIQVYIHQIIVF